MDIKTSRKRWEEYLAQPEPEPINLHHLGWRIVMETVAKELPENGDYTFTVTVTDDRNKNLDD